MNPNQSIAWNENDLWVLQSMWAEGRTSKAIADRLGCTRNAVLGKVHRLGLARNPGSSPKRVRELTPAERQAIDARREAERQEARELATLRPAPRPKPSPPATGGNVQPIHPPPQQTAPPVQPAPRQGRPAGPRTLFQLRADDCRYPLGEAREPATLFCGEPRDGTRVYCAHHCAIAYQPIVPRAARRAA